MAVGAGARVDHVKGRRAMELPWGEHDDRTPLASDGRARGTRYLSTSKVFHGACFPRSLSPLPRAFLVEFPWPPMVRLRRIAKHRN